MKRTARILFSTMLVLMFVFSFAGATPAARAEYIATGSIEAAFYLRQENTGTEPVNYQPYADTENPASADFGNDEGLDGYLNIFACISIAHRYLDRAQPPAA